MGVIRVALVSQSQLVLVLGNSGAVVVAIAHRTTCVRILGEQVIKRGSGADMGDGVGSIVSLAALDGHSPLHRGDIV